MGMKSKAKSFLGLMKSGKPTATNSGIFSGQKKDPQPKPSYGSKAPKSYQRKSVDSNNIKIGMKGK